MRKRTRPLPDCLRPRRAVECLTMFIVVILFVCTSATLAVASTPPNHYDRPQLSPRELSRRAQPADVSDFTAALARRQSSTQGIAPDHEAPISMSQPSTCSPLNITWDPTKGTPPFTIFVAAELWFPIAIVSIPATYADPTLRQWLYQVNLPSFKNPPPGSSETPVIFASVVDSTGLMANTSAFLVADNADAACDKAPGMIEFESWTEGGPTQCQPWHLGWNVTGTKFKGPMKPMMFPEKQPPLALTPPLNVSAELDGTGGMDWTVTVPSGTLIIYSIADEGSPGDGGGVGGKNQVGYNQYAGGSCVPNDPVGLPTPVITAIKMMVTPDYTTASTVTSNGAVVTVSSLVHQGGSDGSPSSARTIGIAVSVAVVALLVVLGACFLFYRRKQKRSETHWEIPGGHSNYPKGMPIDRRFATNAAGESIATAMGSRRDVQSLHSSLNSLGGVEGSHLSSPHSPLQNSMPYSDFSPSTTNGFVGRSQLQYSRSLVNHSNHGSMAGMDGDQAGSTMDSYGGRDPFARSQSSRRGTGTGEVRSMANAYRNALGSTYNEGSDSSNSGGTSSGVGTFSRGEELQMADRAHGSHGSNGGSARNNVVVHHDAGLLLDDSLSDEEDGQGGDSGPIVELPPEYNSIAPRGGRSNQGTSSGSNSAAVGTRTPAFHVTNGEEGSEDVNDRSRTNLLGNSSADAYRDRDAGEMYADDGDDGDEKEHLQRRQEARALRRAAANDRDESSPISPPSAGSTAIVDGGSVFDRAGRGLGQPDEEFFWRR
ncbi:unnamed protein product [Sympodiomycopsis kandeliae]